MPAGTLGFLVETAPDFHGLDGGALWEDVKAAGSVGLKYRKSWERMAVVTDKDWMRHAIAAFGWVSPGELRVFEPDQLEAGERRAAPARRRAAGMRADGGLERAGPVDGAPVGTPVEDEVRRPGIAV